MLSCRNSRCEGPEAGMYLPRAMTSREQSEQEGGQQERGQGDDSRERGHVALKASGFTLHELRAAGGFEQKTGSLTCVFNLFSVVTGLRKSVCEPGRTSEGRWRVITHLHVLRVPWPLPPGTLLEASLWDLGVHARLRLKLAPAPLGS